MKWSLISQRPFLLLACRVLTTRDRLAILRGRAFSKMQNESISYKVLLIEDDPAICSLLRSYLRDTQFKLLEANTARSGLDLVAEKRPDLILLDLGLPDGEGIDVVRAIREWARTPVIIMSGRSEDEAKVAALDAGADDYVTKPFSVTELLARLRVAARHIELRDTDAPIFESGPLKVDYSARQVWLNEVAIKLTPLEYKLLSTLVKHSGKVVTHRQLLTDVWGAEYSEDSQYLRVYMGYLRKKLEPEPDSPRLILTEHRVGYRLAV